MSQDTEIAIVEGSTNVYADLGYADAAEMQRKYALYARLGCLEYYLIDPYLKKIEGFERADGAITFIADAIGRRSPLLGLVLGFDDEVFRFVDGHGDQLISGIEGIAHVAEAEAKVAALSAKLRELGIDPSDVIG